MPIFYFTYQAAISAFCFLFRLPSQYFTLFSGCWANILFYFSGCHAKISFNPQGTKGSIPFYYLPSEKQMLNLFHSFYSGLPYLSVEWSSIPFLYSFILHATYPMNIQAMQSTISLLGLINHVKAVMTTRNLKTHHGLCNKYKYE